MVVNVEVSFKELYTDLDRQQFMKELGEKAEIHWRGRLLETKSIHTGELVSSLTSWSRDNEAVVVGAFYGKFIDTGTKPFWPPYEPLWEWAFSKTGDPEEAAAMARAVQERIAARGVRPQRISEYVLREIEKELGEIIDTKLLKG